MREKFWVNIDQPHALSNIRTVPQSGEILAKNYFLNFKDFRYETNQTFSVKVTNSKLHISQQS